jgi:hypothetical protein
MRQQAGGQNYGSNEGFGRRDLTLPEGRVPFGSGPNNGIDWNGAIRNYIGQLRTLEQQVRNDPSLQREVEELTRALQNLDPQTLANPLIAERINSQVLQEVEQVELQLRRKVEDGQSTSVRNQAAEAVPAGYAGAVAEYFRKLSKSK